MITKIYNITKEELVVLLEEKYCMNFKKATITLSRMGLRGEIK